MVSFNEACESTGVDIKANVDAEEIKALRTLSAKAGDNLPSHFCLWQATSFNWFDHSVFPARKTLFSAQRILFPSLIRMCNLKYEWLSGFKLQIRVHYPEVIC